jgi:hypothetical protein
MLILLDSTVNIYRLSQVSGNKSRYTTLTTSIQSTTQPLGEEKAQFFGGSHGKMYKVFTDVGEDIKEGDQIRDKDGNVYQVVSGGLEKRNDGFMADYMGIVCSKIN